MLVAGGVEHVVELRCSDDPGCVLSSASLAVTPRTGIATGTPQGTLMVSWTGDCTAGGDVELEWSDSGRTPPYFAVLRSEDPLVDPVLERVADVDGTAYTDALAVGPGCDSGVVPYRGAEVVFYLVLDRNDCTGGLVP